MDASQFYHHTCTTLIRILPSMGPPAINSISSYGTDSRSALQRQLRVARTAISIVIRTQIQKQPPRVIGTWLASECQKLGPTYVKLGQFVSSRKDIFGTDFATCFDGLRDQVEPIHPSVIESILDDHPDIKRLLSVDPKPLASASIGQVHRATSKRTGAQLIIKIRRPNIEQIVEDDLQFLWNITSFMASLNMRDSKSTLRMLRDMRKNILREADFKAEAEHIQRFYQEYQGVQMPAAGMTVRIPFLIRTLSTPDIIVMEYVPNDISIDTIPVADRSKVACAIMNFFITQLIDHGIIHGDPHKGNIGVTQANELVLYDFGSIVTVTKDEQYALKELIYMILAGNLPAIMDLLERLGVKIIDRNATKLYIQKYIQYMRSLDIDVFRSLFNATTNDTDSQGPDDTDLDDDDNNIKLRSSPSSGPSSSTEQASSQGAPNLPVRLSSKIVRILKIYGTLEGVCKELDPTFNYFDILDGYITSLVFDEDFLIHKSSKDVGALLSSSNSMFSSLGGFLSPPSQE